MEQQFFVSDRKVLSVMVLQPVNVPYRLTQRSVDTLPIFRPLKWLFSFINKLPLKIPCICLLQEFKPAKTQYTAKIF